MKKGEVKSVERPHYTVQTPSTGGFKNLNVTFYQDVGDQLFDLISPTVV